MKTSEIDEPSRERANKGEKLQCATNDEERSNTGDTTKQVGKKRRIEDAEDDEMLAARRASNRRKAKRFRERHNFINADLRKKLDDACKENSNLNKEKELLFLQNNVLKEQVKKLSGKLTVINKNSIDFKGVETSVASAHGPVGHGECTTEGPANNEQDIIVSGAKNVCGLPQAASGQPIEFHSPEQHEQDAIAQASNGRTFLLPAGGDSAPNGASPANFVTCAESVADPGDVNTLSPLQLVQVTNAIRMQNRGSMSSTAQMQQLINTQTAGLGDRGTHVFDNNQMSQQLPPLQDNIFLQMLQGLLQARFSHPAQSQQSSDEGKR